MESDSNRWLVPLAVTAVVIVALGVWAFFAIEICDQQLADSGDVVDVCRHLQVTDPPVLAAGLVVIAALGAFFTEVTAFGITLKRTVEKAEDAARATSRFELAAREAAGRARLEAVELQADSVESQNGCRSSSREGVRHLQRRRRQTGRGTPRDSTTDAVRLGTNPRAHPSMVRQLDSAQRAEACREIIDQRTTGPDRHIAPGTDRWALSDRLLGPDRLNCR